MGTVLLVTSAGAGAQTGATCESVRIDLTGQNIFGQHTMRQLLQDTRAGNCDAASYLVRRARDAEGFIATHCPGEPDMTTIAAADIRIGEGVLKTPACQD